MSIAVYVYVLDTSYLVELYAVGRYSNATASAEVRRLFAGANSRGGRFFVPLPCLFELGSKIADVEHEARRTQLASKLLTDVMECLSRQRPWEITPAGPPESILPELLRRFSSMAAKRPIGLVDAFIVSEACRLKQRYERYGARVHLWTNDRNLKSMEPDAESVPYHW